MWQLAAKIITENSDKWAQANSKHPGKSWGDQLVPPLRHCNDLFYILATLVYFAKCIVRCQVNQSYFSFFSLSFFFFNSGVKNHGWGIEWLCKIVWVLFKSYGHIWPWYRTLTDYVDRPINSWLTRQIELLWIHSSSISMGKLTQIFCIRIVKYCRRKKKKKSALPPTKNMKKNLCLTSRSFVSFHLQN